MIQSLVSLIDATPCLPETCNGSDTTKCDGLETHVGMRAALAEKVKRGSINASEAAAITAVEERLARIDRERADLEATHAVLLTSPYCIDPTQHSDQARTRHALEALGDCRFIEVDGSENVEFRDRLFRASGHRGKYPQLFVFDVSKPPSEALRFIGLWSQIEVMIENDAMTNRDPEEADEKGCRVTSNRIAKGPLKRLTGLRTALSDCLRTALIKT